jgi:hypothetical protein
MMSEAISHVARAFEPSRGRLGSSRSTATVAGPTRELEAACGYRRKLWVSHPGRVEAREDFQGRWWLGALRAGGSVRSRVLVSCGWAPTEPL